MINMRRRVYEAKYFALVYYLHGDDYLTLQATRAHVEEPAICSRCRSAGVSLSVSGNTNWEGKGRN